MNRREFNLNLVCAAGAIAMPFPQSSTQLRVNGRRVNAHLAELAQYGKTPEGGTHRMAYTNADLQAREYTMKLMREAKLDVVIDAAGNLVGRRAGADPGLKPLLIGSHIDSVPEGGSYDGDVGSMGAIEVARTLAENAVRLRHPLEVIIFQNEEGGTIGSHAISVLQSDNVEDLRRCHVVYVGVTGDGRIAASLGALASHGVLTVHEAASAQPGGVVRFFLTDGGRVRFEVNVAAASREQLSLSSKLLEVSQVVSR